MKTIEEASKGLPENRGYLMSSVEQIAEISFKSGVEFAQRFIPIEEELPNILTDVLVLMSNGKVTIGCRMHDGIFNTDKIDNRFKVTHWRLLYFK